MKSEAHAVGLPSEVRTIVACPLWKRLLDIACIIVALPVLLPLVLAIALLIKCVSRGPVTCRVANREVIWRIGSLPEVDGDIIYVPFTPFRKIEQIADEILSQFVRSLAVNEGQNAIVEGATPVGVSVGFGE